TNGAPTGDTISVGTLALGSAEGQINTNSGSKLTINSPITGTGGATLSGGGGLTLTPPNTFTGTAAGNMTRGTLTMSNGNALGANANTLQLIGGTLLTNITGGIALPYATTLNNSTITLGSTSPANTNPFELTGTVTLTNNTFNTVTTNANTIMSGV